MVHPENVIEPKMETYIAIFEIAGGMGARGEFQADSELNALFSCQAVASGSFPHVKAWMLIHKESNRTIANVPVMQAMSYFAPIINKAAKVMALPVLQMKDEGKFKDMMAKIKEDHDKGKK